MDKSIITNAAKIEKVETKNLLGFCKIELVPNLIFIGALSMNLSIGPGNLFLFASLDIVASLGVMLKILCVEINVVTIVKMINKIAAAPTTQGLSIELIVGIE